MGKVTPAQALGLKIHAAKREIEGGKIVSTKLTKSETFVLWPDTQKVKHYNEVR